MTQLIIGGVPVEAVSFRQLPNEGNGDWGARAWSFTALLETQSEVAALRAALQDTGPRSYRRMINGALRGGPLIVCAGDQLGGSITAGVEIGTQDHPNATHRQHELLLTLRESMASR